MFYLAGTSDPRMLDRDSFNTALAHI